jgi:hypothetical protein
MEFAYFEMEKLVKCTSFSKLKMMNFSRLRKNDSTIFLVQLSSRKMENDFRDVEMIKRKGGNYGSIVSLQLIRMVDWDLIRIKEQNLDKNLPLQIARCWFPWKSLQAFFRR